MEKLFFYLFWFFGCFKISEGELKPIWSILTSVLEKVKENSWKDQKCFDSELLLKLCFAKINHGNFEMKKSFRTKESEFTAADHSAILGVCP